MSQNIELLDTILMKAPVIPVLTLTNSSNAVKVAKALAKGGLTSIEITLRTDCALDCIRKISSEVPEVTVGAGTILSARQYEAAVNAGAHFAVSPGSTETLFNAAKSFQQCPLLPGVSTPTETMQAAEKGYERLKFFPALASGGPSLLKALAAPFPSLRFCPTGGITLANAKDFLALSNVLCVGGTWISETGAVDAQNWLKIEAHARKAAALSP
ncbi:bifunctional 4-hydroxy-2-oxoglutarate aldolase/2-dehydro-3-deoxy-phosphogluconate aldolase [Flexibacterium corallicola]|uniref:bifunctional 4-hydroxy-2-oxoglutarate aldolase/2-dehydro-3-deoxy-phosphogluconate aldolase n=1 Tax=Flexibacterium corallicola TaxID=3037259 RepID=UPI00286F9CA3|nr:bifunctional 4-hydroxy-2-oxoglutarate aldolase/2-dehydro-3-deoxy-phosphogluconate aldolase [Pseudovibrio sp. M1P-2-3]